MPHTPPRDPTDDAEDARADRDAKHARIFNDYIAARYTALAEQIVYDNRLAPAAAPRAS